MKAAYIDRPGPPDRLKYGTLPTPLPGEREVLVRIRAASVNPIDTYIRSGMVALNLPSPYIPGVDFAGVVDFPGAKVTNFKTGDRVWGTGQGRDGRQGTYAEYLVLPEKELHRSPAGIPDEEVAAMACVGLTAHLGLFHHAKVRRGETLFVTGGSGGVGSAVVQMARLAGARIITTARSEAKEAVCRRFGADEVIRYKEHNVSEAVRGLAPEGVDVWFETTREANFELAIPLLKLRGRMIVMAGRDAMPVFPVGPFYVKDCRLLGYSLFNAAPATLRRSAAEMSGWMAEKRLRANIGKIMPLQEAAQAHRLQEQSTIRGMGTLTGKIVLKP